MDFFLGHYEHIDQDLICQLKEFLRQSFNEALNKIQEYYLMEKAKKSRRVAIVSFSASDDVAPQY